MPYFLTEAGITADAPLTRATETFLTISFIVASPSEHKQGVKSTFDPCEQSIFSYFNIFSDFLSLFLNFYALFNIK